MPGESSGEHPDRRVKAAPRAARADSFARALGDAWVEVEPGIYRLGSPSVPDQPAGPVDQTEEPPSVDQELLDALSIERGLPEAPTARDSAAPGRFRWRRR
jgi:hypothetical protein